MMILQVISLPRENGTHEYLLKASQAEVDALARMAGQVAVDPEFGKNIDIPILVLGNGKDEPA